MPNKNRHDQSYSPKIVTGSNKPDRDTTVNNGGERPGRGIKGDRISATPAFNSHLVGREKRK